uniref:Radial spoke head protein 9 homolog n=1 Tax=Chromera velia CCMP2878 TaxID=1169474 RepID=A0A0G4HHJ8_9ALVE|eukprot:Cvel_6887.t1-p1 / transcript=Cvel_6887.t1 / gene=Cvel_6887 / organism=Chromera_velia_CCMP2878 / gene_product=Radial spoke head protein 9 homolog, putative / transcript_product=Radial spoke head protein 9 homolog, putative / location=Cvel_scaffold348:44412-47489(+) / protein_length=270 / sequence_SO=supercontig / SO=protein_coding / is_pseudo=false
MEFQDIEFGMEHIATHGKVLNIHETTRLKAGLAKLKVFEGASSVFFWGKIFGATESYYIAYLLTDGDFEFPSKKFYWSNSSFEFAELPVLSENDTGRVLSFYDEIDAPFTGVPDRRLGTKPGDEVEEEEPPPPEEEGEDAPPRPPPPLKLTEVHRLSVVVSQIEKDTAAVPRGAYRLDEGHKVNPAFAFRGLMQKEALKLSSWVHFRPPTNVDKLRALTNDNVQFHSDFMDPIDLDLPGGYAAFHVAQSRYFGGCYLGNGDKRRDLPFLL